MLFVKRLNGIGDVLIRIVHPSYVRRTPFRRNPSDRGSDHFVGLPACGWQALRVASFSRK